VPKSRNSLEIIDFTIARIFEFRLFGLVFVLPDFELGRNVSCEESTVSPVQGYLIFIIFTNVNRYI